MIPLKTDTENGTITYTVDKEEAYILDYTGRDLEVVIPENIDGYTVTCIKKKAFLSKQFIKSIILPNSINRIEDYAFARCRKLESITLPYDDIYIGQDILKDCDRLQYIYNGYNKNDNSDIAFLLAKTLNELNAFFLFDLKNAGSEEWFKHFDATIDMRMKKDDMEDFSKMILCGEEEVVCGEDGTIEDSNPDHYRSNRVKEKVRIAFLRLLHDYMLSDNLESILKDYLLSHTKGCKTEETWQVILNEHGDDKEYYDYLLKINGINSSNINDIITDMGNRHMEMKSYLINSNNDIENNDNAFSDFEL